LKRFLREVEMRRIENFEKKVGEHPVLRGTSEPAWVLILEALRQ
jgi:hypothetical protein